MSAPTNPHPGAMDAERSRLFGVLARLLGHAPDDALLDALARLPAGTGPIGSAIGGLARAAAVQDAATVTREYAALFVGVARGELLPYGSYYRTGFLHERPLADLRADLARLGVARAAGIAEPEDHIAFLCDVMAGLLAGRFAGDADAGVAAAAPAFAQRSDQVPAKEARKENEATRLAARYQESAHVKEFYRNNRYEH